MTTDAAGASGKAAESRAAGAASEGAAAEAGAEGAAAGEAGAAEADFQEPFVARVSRLIWTTIKTTAATGLFCGVLYAGYTIVTTLLPVGASANSIMRKAGDALAHDPDVHSYYGDIKTYGIDMGGTTEGRRYFVPEYKYDDPLTGEPYHRVKFTLEGERNRKASVFAEVAESSGEFRYLITVSKDGSRVISVIDRRPRVLTHDERQARVTSLLQDAGWTFYADNDVDARQQAAVLGEYWLKVKCVRCDENPARCEEAGVTGFTPAWGTLPVGDGANPVGKLLLKLGFGSGYAGGVVQGVKELAAVEEMVRPLAREKERAEVAARGSAKKL